MFLPSFRNKFAVSWPPDDERKPRLVQYLSTRILFEQAHQSDLHFAAYNSSARWRLNSDAAGRVDWHIVALVIDVDSPKNGNVDEWFSLEKQKLKMLFSGSPVGVAYRSKSGGYRLVWWLAKPFDIATKESLTEWRRLYLRACIGLFEQFGIVTDPKCSDATRLFRAPRVMLPDGTQTVSKVFIAKAKRNLDLQSLLIDSSAEISAISRLAKQNESWQEAQNWLSQVSKPACASSLARRPSSPESAPILLRAERYLSKLPPSISGQGGQKDLWNAAFAMVMGFGLSVQDATYLLASVFNPRCQPPWRERELQRTAENAARSNQRGGFLL